MRSYTRGAALLVASAILAGGCALSPRADPSQFYVLNAPPYAESAASGDLTLGLGPITLPQYLRRPQMVTRAGENRVSISEDHRWAEDLDAGLTRVMREDLQRATGASQIYVHPWLISRSVRYAVEVDILRFEGDSAGSVALWAKWRIRDGATHDVLVARESRITQQGTGAEASAVVTAQSQAIVTLSREVAGALLGIEH